MSQLQFHYVTIDDRELFNSFFKEKKVKSFDASFVNCFILAQEGNIQIATDDDALYVIQEWSGYYPFMLQPYVMDEGADLVSCVLKGADYMKSEFHRVNYKFVLEDTKSALEEAGFNCLFHLDLNNSEYLYLTDDLLNLKGKKYHSKRNHINKLKNTYEVEYIPYDASMRDICFDIEREWMRERSVTSDELSESVAIERLITNFDILGVKGCVIKINGEYVGFSIGERLTDETALIHIEKCLGRYDGAYQYINNSFIANEWADTVYVNRAEDMGISGLRKSKESYYPCGMVYKYDMFFEY